MSESDAYIRIQALMQLLYQLKAQLEALNQRLVNAEQSLQGRWMYDR